MIVKDNNDNKNNDNKDNNNNNKSNSNSINSENLTLDLHSFPVPECAQFMEAKFEEHIAGKSISFSFPVKEEYLNPGKTMQGGFITAAFDNVFGPLSVLEMGTFFAAAVSINTSYHRPVFLGDYITVTAYVKAKGKKKLHMLAEACNREGKIVATATSDYLVTEPK